MHTTLSLWNRDGSVQIAFFWTTEFHIHEQKSTLVIRICRRICDWLKGTQPIVIRICERICDWPKCTRILEWCKEEWRIQRPQPLHNLVGAESSIPPYMRRSWSNSRQGTFYSTLANVEVLRPQKTMQRLPTITVPNGMNSWFEFSVGEAAAVMYMYVPLSTKASNTTSRKSTAGRVLQLPEIFTDARVRHCGTSATHHPDTRRLISLSYCPSSMFCTLSRASHAIVQTLARI